ncbi:TfdA family taurine catabolism dioxygenase TauD [Xylariaceae sp. AK1471]|nr:TfdA family taurine catabolism dioxygenase TauD [Xylariaceae sp. AK1471]
MSNPDNSDFYLSPEQIYPSLKLFTYNGCWKYANASYPGLLHGDVTVAYLITTIGTEVHDMQTSTLSIADVLEFAAYFSRLHIHPTSGSPVSYPEIHLVHQAAGDESADKCFEARTNSAAWHSDVSCEAQLPDTAFLHIPKKPGTGGIRYSPTPDQAGSCERCPRKHQAVRAIAYGHLIVQTHPVGGKEALFVNPHDLAMREIFLFDYIAFKGDTVLLWNNRKKKRRYMAPISLQVVVADPEYPYEQV